MVDNLHEHIQQCCITVYNCRKCQIPLPTGSKRKRHEEHCSTNVNNTVALNGLFRITKIPLPSSTDHEYIITEQAQRITTLLILLLTSALKFYVGVKVEMTRRLNDIHDHIYFNTGSTMLLRGSDILAEVKEHLNKLIKKIHVYIRNGSGWSLVRVSEIAIMTTKYNPMGGSSYIELPAELKKRNCLLNIKNDDQLCIVWCILASKYPQSKHADRVSKYKPHINELKLNGVSFPTPLTDIGKLEELNEIAINVYG